MTSAVVQHLITFVDVSDKKKKCVHVSSQLFLKLRLTLAKIINVVTLLSFLGDVVTRYLYLL